MCAEAVPGDVIGHSSPMPCRFVDSRRDIMGSAQRRVHTLTPLPRSRHHDTYPSETPGRAVNVRRERKRGEHHDCEDTC